MVKRGHPIRQIRILYLYSFLLFLQPLRHFVPPPLYFCVAKTQGRSVGFTSSFICCFHFSFSPVSRSLTGCHKTARKRLLFNPLPLYSLTETPRHAAGHGRGGLCYKGLSFPAKKSPCYTNSLYLFILLNSEKNELRSAAAVIGLLGSSLRHRRGLRNSLRSDSPRPFSSVFLATSPPDKGGDFARAFASLFNPLALRALPLYRCAAQGERFKSVASNILNSSIAVPRSFMGYFCFTIGDI